MIQITQQQQTTPYGEGEFPQLDLQKCRIDISEGWQAVLYEKEHFQGNSLVLDAHAKATSFNLSDTSLTHAKSMRTLANVTIVPGHLRDRNAFENAMESDSWLQKSFTEIPERMQWLTDQKFGCFVHWGVYVLGGGEFRGKRAGYAEHLMRVAKINLKDYKEQFIEQFNPVDFNADEWIRTIKDAGMKYFVITAKHHDGFAMNASDVYPYDVRMTPFKRDIIAELNDACKAHHIPFGVYYSHAFDWEHPDAPGNDWEYTNGGGDLFLFEGKKGRWFDEHPELVPRTAKYYVDQKSIPQILELIEKYDPALLWFDTPHKLPPSENLRILQAIREKSDKVIVNGRLARNPQFLSLADYVNTGDRAAEFFPTPGNWETIPTTNESYGYSKIDHTHKPPEHFIKMLIKTAARGGTVLMNIGPTELGVIDKPDLDILKSIGSWLKINGESYYGTIRSPLGVQTFGETTLKDNKLYLHLFEDCQDAITLSGMINPIDKVYLLTDENKTPLKTHRLNYYDQTIILPESLPAYTVLVAAFTGEILHGGGSLISNTQENVLKVFDAQHIASTLSHGDGKLGRDYVMGFTQPEESVIWYVRAPKKTAYTLQVQYTTLDPNSSGTYSIYVNKQRFVKDLTATDKMFETITDAFDVTIEGEQEIIFSPHTFGTSFLQLYGVALIPKSAALENTIIIEEDTTDTGGK